jgi:hypothetical protein
VVNLADHLSSSQFFAFSPLQRGEAAVRAAVSRSLGKDFRLSFRNVWDLSGVPKPGGRARAGDLFIWFAILSQDWGGKPLARRL